MRQVIITADDFGIAVETNLAVEMAHRQGVLTSASIMPNMPAFEHAVAIAHRNPRLGIGVHLSLTSGRPVTPARDVPLLVDDRGLFRYGYVGLSRLVLGPNKASVLGQIAEELAAQIQRARDAGLEIDHLDGHRHVHMIPAVWQIVEALGREHHLPVRFSAEQPSWGVASRRAIRNLVKAAVLHACARVNRPSQPLDVRFAGLIDSGCVNVRVLRRLLSSVPVGTTEIVTHPSLPLPAGRAAVCCSEEDMVFLRARGRQSELDALVHPKVRSLLREHRIRPVTFGAVGVPRTRPRSRTATC